MASAETWRRRGRPLALPSVAAMLVGCDTLGMGGPTALQVDVRLTATSPGIRVERSGQSLPYQPNMLLRGGDRVRTGPATYAAIDFANDNTVYMNHDTWVMVGSIRVFLGEIFTAIARIGAGSEVYERPLGGGRGHDVPAPGRPAGHDRDRHRGPGALHPDGRRGLAPIHHHRQSADLWNRESVRGPDPRRRPTRRPLGGSGCARPQAAARTAADQSELRGLASRWFVPGAASSLAATE
jgi:hypothetical protein